ncbi:TonB-dependent receptor [Psychromonas sp. Urea-02u-13]|uniref:TonB-dependent receptor n=1 Tax=Psychromonas sp. Urea-02u-13 TaxID=2058326 RepID=UPI000C320D38|nr:TonB-dependent receptor [Psychromonas sp. Urea-02u-13]PKG39102.1 TonB-dependent receptor [Psychromonas sp. Urea-02u-13]
MHRKHPKLSKITLCIAMSTLCSNAFAQENEQEVMIIEATKQGTSIGQVDNSIIVKTGEELERAGIHEVKDLEKVFPGLVIQTRGNRTYANTTIRGISSSDFYSPTVSIYVDGILQDAAYLTQQLQNVEHIELLRGPQGTLYGGNAQGGIINIVTNKATRQPKASANVLYSNLSRQLDGSASVALNDTIYADVVVRALQDEGNITHLPSNTEKANETKEISGMARLHYLSDDSPINATLSFSAGDLNSHEEWYLTQSEFDKKETNQDIPELERVVNTISLNVGYDFENSTVTSITAYQDRAVKRTFIGGTWIEDQGTFSQELRVNTRFNDSLTMLLGGYFENRQLDVNSGAQNNISTDTYALFGQSIYSLTSAVDLTLGLRASRMSTNSNYAENAAWGINEYDQSKSENVVSPKAAIGWQATQDTRLYTSVASGYRPGGFSAVPRSNGDKDGFDAEKSLNWELGWRTTLLNNTLAISGALYLIETKDVQLYTGTPGSKTLSNHGNATSQGLELELAVYPTDDLTVTLAGTSGKSTFESGNAGLEGNRLPYAPDTTATFGLEYYLAQTLVEGDISLVSNARYTSKMYFDEHNSQSQAGYALVDVALIYDFNDHLSFRLFSNNVTDEEYKTYSFSMRGTSLSNYGTGREVGLNAKMKW